MLNDERSVVMKSLATCGAVYLAELSAALLTLLLLPVMKHLMDRLHSTGAIVPELVTSVPNLAMAAVAGAVLSALPWASFRWVVLMSALLASSRLLRYLYYARLVYNPGFWWKDLAVATLLFALPLASFVLTPKLREGTVRAGAA